MSYDDFRGSQALDTIAVDPHEHLAIDPEYARRPSLCDVLSNSTNTDSPWSLGTFKSFLAHNYCSEVLEFTTDTASYRRIYDSLILHDDHRFGSHNVEDAYMAWRNILDTYIKPNSENEINIPGEVRNNLLSHQNPYEPPNPEVLDDADRLMHDLMNGIFIQFLESEQALNSSEGKDGSETSSGSRAHVTLQSSHSNSNSSFFRAHLRPQPLSSSLPPSQTSSPASFDSGPPSTPTSTRSLNHFHLPHTFSWGHGSSHDASTSASEADAEAGISGPFYRRAHDLWGKTRIYQNIRSRRSADSRKKDGRLGAKQGPGENEIPRSVPTRSDSLANEKDRGLKKLEPDILDSEFTDLSGYARTV